MRKEVRLAGFGGQGIIRSGLILSMAASIYSDMNAVQTQSYGPESRGGSCKSEVVISDKEIDFPLVDNPDVLVIMSQEAYLRYVASAKKGATILVDSDMVSDFNDVEEKEAYYVPATKTAKELGKTIIANVVMLGALTAITDIVSKEAMKESVLQNIPKGTEKLNMEAFEKGYDYGRQLMKKQHGRKEES